MDVWQGCRFGWVVIVWEFGLIWSSRAGDLVGFGGWTGFIDLVVFRFGWVRLSWALGWIGTFG